MEISLGQLDEFLDLPRVFDFLEYYYDGIVGTLTGLAIFILISFVPSYFRRPRFIKVNCWFCCNDSEVLSRLKDSWNCSCCGQYNGFTKNGDYNKVIRAQYHSSLNRPIKGASPAGEPLHFSHNGLCSKCNSNQELKIHQLASFVPSRESNYDVEIEAETERLDKIYRLCSKCELVVKSKLVKDEKVPSLVELKTNVSKSSSNSSTPSGCKSKSNLNMSSCTSQSMERNSSSSTLSDANILNEDCSILTDSDSDDIDLNRLKIDAKQRSRVASKDSISSCSSPFPLPYRNTMLPFTLPHNPNLMVKPQLPSCHGLYETHPSLPLHSNPSLSRSPSPPLSDSFFSHSSSCFPTWNRYQSCSVATIFGGRPQKPLISPSRLSNGHLLNPLASQGMMYSQNSAQCEYPFFGNHLSRSSSQSSGFFSMNNGFGGCSPAPSVLSGFEGTSDRLSLFSEPWSTLKGGNSTCMSNNFASPFSTTYQNNFVSNGNTCSRFGPGPRSKVDVERRHDNRHNQSAKSESCFDDGNFTDDEYFSDDESTPVKTKGRYSEGKMRETDSFPFSQTSPKSKVDERLNAEDVNTTGSNNSSRIQFDGKVRDQHWNWKRVVMFLSFLMNSVILFSFLLWTANVLELEDFEKYFCFVKTNVFSCFDSLTFYVTTLREALLPICNSNSNATADEHVCAPILFV